MDLQSRHVEPDTSTTTTTTDNAATTRPKRAWKLRQTCDSCSTAKVKCDKGNPRCGRCDRLSYECIYSPARRIGRPRPRTQDDGKHTASGTAGPAPGAGKPAPQAPARPLNLSVDLVSNGLSGGGSHLNAAGSAHHDGSNPGSNSTSNDASCSSSMDMGEQDQGPYCPYEYDCATVAVATIRKLVEGSTQDSQITLTDHIPHACKQAARILVCPCSADMDAALLTASLASAILDIANTALHTLKALDGEQHTVLALGTLPNISQVVTLFTHRYSITQANRPPEALLMLAASLRTTLKAIAEETTNSFLDSSPRVEVATS